MNKSELFEILQQLNSLFTYSDLLPEDFKNKYLEDLGSLKTRITSVNLETTQAQPKKNEDAINITTTSDSIKIETSFSQTPKPPMGKAPPPPLPSQFTSTGTFMNFQRANQLENERKIVTDKMDNLPPTKIEAPAVKNFVIINNCLIPKLTDEGKKIMGDLSLPIEHYKILKTIDNNSSIYEIYSSNAHNYKDFLEFILIFYNLELEKYIYFIKTVTNVQNKGWIKLGEIFSEGKVTSETNIMKAVTHQKTRKGMFIGESLLELNLITDINLRDGLKIQRWVSKLSESALFLKSSQTEIIPQPVKSAAEKKLIPNILDFIIPVFNTKVDAILADPERKDLAERLSIIDGTASILKIFTENKESFKGNILSFLRFISKLEAQEILFYKKNNHIQERNIWIKFGELLVNLGLIESEQVEQAFNARLNNEKIKNRYIGEVLVHFNFIDSETLEETLKIQKWCNAVLAKISYENAFVSGIESVLKDSFNCPVEIGNFKKMSFLKPLEGMVCIIFPISGKLNGFVYYIMDRLFMSNLTKTLMASYGMVSSELDESIIAEISNMITGSSLTHLSNIGLSCQTNIPRIIMEKEITIAEGKAISVVPLMNQWGRFAIGLEISD